MSGQPNGPEEFRDPITGCRIQPLTAGPADHWLLSAPDTSLTPAGDHLLFLARSAGAPHPTLCRRDMGTGAIEPIIETDHLMLDGIVPAANSRQVIALLRGEEGEVAAIDMETGECETLAVFPDAELEGCHRSASGEYIVTVVTRGEESVITAVHTEGMRTVPILEAPRGVHSARFSPDSKNSVLYVTHDPPEIRCVEFDGTGDRVLVSGVRVFRPGEVEGRPAPVDSEHLNTRTLEYLNRPIWRGSGEEVLFFVGGESRPIMAVPRAGGELRVVSTLPCSWLRSDARGERLVAVTAAAGGAPFLDGQVILLNPVSGNAMPLVSRCACGAQPSFSPDGQSVLYEGRADHFKQIYQVWMEEMHP